MTVANKIYYKGGATYTGGSPFFKTADGYKEVIAGWLKQASGYTQFYGVAPASILPAYAVTPTGAGLKDGSNWDNAFGIPEFLASIASKNSYTPDEENKEYWFEQGLYTFTNSITIVNGAIIKGGFSRETTAEERNTNFRSEIAFTRNYDVNDFNSNIAYKATRIYFDQIETKITFALHNGFYLTAEFNNCNFYYTAKLQFSHASTTDSRYKDINDNYIPPVYNIKKCKFRDMIGSSYGHIDPSYARSAVNYKILNIEDCEFYNSIGGAGYGNIYGTKYNIYNIKRCKFINDSLSSNYCLPLYITDKYTQPSVILWENCLFYNIYQSSNSKRYDGLTSEIYVNCTFDRVAGTSSVAVVAQSDPRNIHAINCIFRNYSMYSSGTFTFGNNNITAFGFNGSSSGITVWKTTCALQSTADQNFNNSGVKTYNPWVSEEPRLDCNHNLLLPSNSQALHDGTGTPGSTVAITLASGTVNVTMPTTDINGVTRSSSSRMTLGCHEETYIPETKYHVSTTGSSNATGADWNNTISLDGIITVLSNINHAVNVRIYLKEGSYSADNIYINNSNIRNLELIGGFEGIETDYNPTSSSQTVINLNTVRNDQFYISLNSGNIKISCISLYNTSNSVINGGSNVVTEIDNCSCNNLVINSKYINLKQSYFEYLCAGASNNEDVMYCDIHSCCIEGFAHSTVGNNKYVRFTLNNSTLPLPSSSQISSTLPTIEAFLNCCTVTANTMQGTYPASVESWSCIYHYNPSNSAYKYHSCYINSRAGNTAGIEEKTITINPYDSTRTETDIVTTGTYISDVISGHLVSNPGCYVLPATSSARANSNGINLSQNHVVGKYLRIPDKDITGASRRQDIVVLGSSV